MKTMSIRAFCFFLLAVVTLAFNLPSLIRQIQFTSSEYKDFQTKPLYCFSRTSLAVPRLLVEQNCKPQDSLFLLVDASSGLSARDRTLHQTVLWLMLPNSVRYGSLNQLKEEKYVLIPSHLQGSEMGSVLGECGYFPFITQDGHELWRQYDASIPVDLSWGLTPLTHPSAPTYRNRDVRLCWRREIRGVLFVLSVFLVPFLMRGFVAGTFSFFLFSLFFGGSIGIEHPVSCDDNPSDRGACEFT